MSAEWISDGTVIQIPLLGAVAAGQPLEVFTVEETVAVPRSLWNGRRVFALRVRGQSMIEAGIQDGDVLIVEPAADADDGRTVVAEVDGRVTVKKLFREAGGEIRLQPANPTMLPLHVRGEHVQIRGVVVGILRKYGFRPARRTASMPAHASPAPLRSVSRPVADGRIFELTVNAIDTRLERWQQWQAAGTRSRPASRTTEIAALGRDLKALREWCGRTSKPKLRRALLDEATKLMQRMDRFLDTASPP
jgi:hypothetical protein